MSTTPAVTSNRIPNPFHRGQQIRIPAGTPVRSTNPKHHGEPFTTKRAQTVLLRQAHDGYVDLWDDAKRGIGFVWLPTVTWAGGSGYWHDVKVTPEFCAALGVEVPALPVLGTYDARRLDVEPGYGPGYDNRDM